MDGRELAGAEFRRREVEFGRREVERRVGGELGR